MTAPRRHPPHDHHHHHHDGDPLLSELHEEILPGPDVTDSVMQRLGYVQVNPQAARLARLQRWATRCAVLMLFGTGALVGWNVYRDSDAIRRPSGPTLPGAVENDLRQHQHRINNMMELIRQSPQRLKWTIPADDADTSPSLQQHGPPDLQNQPKPAPQEFHVGPFRWV